jgi:threonine synthase
MDVGAPSNFERLRWTFPRDSVLRERLRADCVDDAAIRHTIALHAREYDEVFCPHTATAMHVLDRLRGMGDTTTRWTVVATAHPAKFDHVVEAPTGRVVAVPPALAVLLARPSSAEPIAATDAALQRWLKDSAG